MSKHDILKAPMLVYQVSVLTSRFPSEFSETERRQQRLPIP